MLIRILPIVRITIAIMALPLLSDCGSGGGSDSGSGAGSANNSTTGSTAPAASRVYGQSGNFTTTLANSDGVTANSLKGPTDIANDGVGTYIVDNGNHRVLYYAGTSTTATRVYGQGGSFNTNTASKGGVTAESLAFPLSIAIDAGGVYVGAAGRVLYYSGTSTIASRVYGQHGSFTSNTVNNGGVSATSLSGVGAIAIDAGGIYFADSANHRVLYFAGTSTTATRVYGQAGSFTTNTLNNGGISADSLNYPTGVAVDATGVYIADSGNNRVLYYSGTSTTATRVYGQAGSFTTSTINNGGSSANSLWGPSRVAVDAGGVYISDSVNWRVLYYSGTSTTATRVYGQNGSFSGFGNATLASADGLYEPKGIALVAGGVFIADASSNRALFYSGTSTTATRVFGQTDNFTGTSANPAGLGSLNTPYSLAADSSGIYVADSFNNRVLYFAGNSTTPTRVYGQAGNFYSNVANNGGVSADSLSAPIAVAVDASGVYIVDNGNHRVLYYSGSSTTATRVYGQTGSFSTRNSNKTGINGDGLFGCSGVAVDPAGVYISDYGNHRVLYYTGVSTTASRVYGQAGSFTSATLNNGGVSANSLYGPLSVAADAGGVYVVDLFNFRVLYFAGTSTTASRVYGQNGSFTSSAITPIPSATTLFQARGIALDATGVYIADTGFSRVVYYAGASTTASRVYGQSGFTTTTTSNTTTTAQTLHVPQGVAIGNGGIYVADTGNHRILFYWF
ncbi:NHL repeat-containing protein [Turneriella parva]|uniref:NHL repeat containing protein n=1 Tax=Turneriella parva (strain ATCC BAA-1111 / DSM 21527 / NCTC 11395 / H) TaxID=869212 RepID=I4B516_TURPD|nr:NHL repeat-containing protein [Turneriella parva]AFM12373.1 NHL repeat containing protein [Turneriella parva DSM 21527]